jgi:hypothetical protein
MTHLHIFRLNFIQVHGSTQSITNDGNSDLQPDWVWIKARSDTEVTHAC